RGGGSRQVSDRPDDRLVQDRRSNAGSASWHSTGGGVRPAERWGREMTRRRYLCVAALAVASFHLGLLPARTEQALAEQAHAEHDCQVPPEMMQVSVKLPHLAARPKP